MPQYELWPVQTSARQLQILYYRQWPEMVSDTDRPPWFLNPSILVHGALADAFRFRRGKDDAYYSPDLAMQYEARFMQGMQDAINNDESKFQRAYSFKYENVFGAGGANFWRSHDSDLVYWNL